MNYYTDQSTTINALQKLSHHKERVPAKGFLLWLKNTPDWFYQISDKNRYAHAPFYYDIVQKLPNLTMRADINRAVISAIGDIDKNDVNKIQALLQKLMPWRKGGFYIGADIDDTSIFKGAPYHGVYINSEWRSDIKWQRIASHLHLKDKRVLDVGGSLGYHAFRMKGAGASQVFIIEPSCLFYHQYLALQKFLRIDDIHFLPTVLENLAPTYAFDYVFSMGVLYHRASPFEHLAQLKSQLKKGAKLILETLVIDGDENSVLVPKNRYAKMNNVYFLPSVQALIVWLQKAGFADVCVLDVSATTNIEQRKTAFMDFESLDDFIKDGRTVEGYPAPVRAVLMATA